MKEHTNSIKSKTKIQRFSLSSLYKVDGNGSRFVRKKEIGDFAGIWFQFQLGLLGFGAIVKTHFAINKQFVYIFHR